MIEKRKIKGIARVVNDIYNAMYNLELIVNRHERVPLFFTNSKLTIIMNNENNESLISHP